ncbi:MAG: DNA alkylation repair protein, partial [Prevotella sp.]|nr:DNA alkylation repair protein [Prevotella sp.]
GYLADKPRDILYQMAESNWLWDNRIAMVATLAFIKNKDSDDTYRLALKMMNHKHDLMHKAIGWMLRESGKRDDARRLYCFVDVHRKEMPRTMLRYAIEKFSEAERKYLMRK